MRKNILWEYNVVLSLNLAILCKLLAILYFVGIFHPQVVVINEQFDVCLGSW